MRAVRWASLILALVLVLAGGAWAWYPATDTAGPVTVTIGAVGEVLKLETPIPVRVTVENKGNAAITGRLKIGVTDEWRVEGENPRAFSVGPAAKQELEFTLIVGRGVYAAHYPIHAYADFVADGKPLQAHAVFVTQVAPGALVTPEAPPREWTVTRIQEAGSVALERLRDYRVEVVREGKPTKDMPVGWSGADPESGTNFMEAMANRPDAKPCLIIHPPWRNGAGAMYADARFALPNVRPIKLTFATAIRDNTAQEPPSDGVEWRVYVAPEGGEFTQLFRRFSLAKRWEPAEVDLSAFAGKTITLRLWNGPGPAMNTTCDSGYWAEPTLTIGEPRGAESAADIQARRKTATARARAALKGQGGHFQWRLKNAAGDFGVGWAAGPYGFADGALAFATADKAVVFDHFLMSIGGEDVRGTRSSARVTGGKAKWTPDGRTTTIMDFVQLGEETVQVESTMSVENGVFKIRFAMPVAQRDKRGDPRFTLLGLGPADQKARRVYAGFGNVIQDPAPFTLGESGFGLSTRHVGLDFENGISLVQASDVFPYRLVVDPGQKLYSLQTGHDATLMLVPSVKGAFAAARVYRDASGFKPAGGVEKLRGKMVIDWWGGSDIAADVRRAGAYGLNDSVFLQHAWQRWGYDYRLPDVYPPNCDPKVWSDLVSAAKSAGMLFGIHDNYIDFYPDASGFSYQYILFNPDGTPQRAWYNPGPDAQSYRWLPGAYQPWLERNLKLEKDEFAPTAYFIDVFSAIPLLDYYDQSGAFHTKVECGKHWGECFDYVRKTLGDNAPTISEAGHDGLVGHLDGSEADHMSTKAWGWQGGDSERTPWHDMATHGSFVLLAGGLGPRYAGGNPYADWGSDDYLSNTIQGGRNPMCTGPCTRDTVMTYWLQHDLCRELARQSFESHEFVGDNLHRQHTTFGGGGETWVNRGAEPWTVQGVVLPRYGYLARSGGVISSITLKEGVSVGYAHSPEATFVDARPASADMSGHAPVKTHVVSAKGVGGGTVECEVEWEVLKPLPEGTVIFVHICHDKVEGQGEKIALQPPMDLPPEQLQQVGVHRCKLRFAFPDNLWDGEYRLRYGLYRPKAGGGRLVPIAYLDESRVRGGIFTVTKEGGKVESVEYRPEVPPAEAPQGNEAGKPIDFGAIVTDGAFRLLHSGREWKLLPLQGSLPFKAEIRLDQLGAKGKRVAKVEGLNQEGARISDEKFDQAGQTLKLDLDAKAFSYRITME